MKRNQGKAKGAENEEPKYTIFTEIYDQFYFRLIAPNGEVILGSKGYKSKSGCNIGIQSIMYNAPEDD